MRQVMKADVTSLRKPADLTVRFVDHSAYFSILYVTQTASLPSPLHFNSLLKPQNNWQCKNDTRGRHKAQLCLTAARTHSGRKTAFEMWWHTRTNQISSFGETESPFNSARASIESTAGSRGVRTSGSNAGYTMFRGSVKSSGYPFHSPVSTSLPLPCVTVCHHISTGLYQIYSEESVLQTKAIRKRSNLYRRKLTWIIYEYSDHAAQ